MNRRLLVALVAFSLVRIVDAQGPLTPPAAPAPSMKALNQIASSGVEINATNTPGTATSVFNITAPGSYFLSAALTGVNGKHGILISADNVSIELNGFELNGAGIGSAGITIVGIPRSGVTIRNGFVRNWTGAGVDISFANNCHVENVTSTGNGSYGIAVGENATVRRCRVNANATFGILTSAVSVVDDCVAELTTGFAGVGIQVGSASVVRGCSASVNNASSGGGIATATGCSVIHCTASYNGGDSGVGIRLGNNSNASECVATGNNGSNGVGIQAGSTCTVTGCSVSANAADGILATTLCTISGNTSSVNGGAGIHTTGNSNRIDGNNVVQNQNHGVTVSGTVSVIVRNTASGNAGGNYSIAASNGNAVAVSTAPNFTSTDPNANLSF